MAGVEVWSPIGAGAATARLPLQLPTDAVRRMPSSTFAPTKGTAAPASPATALTVTVGTEARRGRGSGGRWLADVSLASGPRTEPCAAPCGAAVLGGSTASVELAALPSGNGPIDGESLDESGSACCVNGLLPRCDGGTRGCGAHDGAAVLV